MSTPQGVNRAADAADDWASGGGTLESSPKINGQPFSQQRQEDCFYHPFPSPYQSEPADLMTTVFAGRRRLLLEGIYASIEGGQASTLLRRNWARHCGKACTGRSWKGVKLLAFMCVARLAWLGSRHF